MNLKVNTDDSVIGLNAAHGGVFRDHLRTFLGTFSCNLGNNSVFKRYRVIFMLWNMQL